MITNASSSLESLVKAQALGIGFDLVGITRTGPATTGDHFDRWLLEGRAGTMDYMSRTAALRRDSRLPFEGGVSAIVVALDYGGKESPGPVARYARGDDYHVVMWRMLDELHAWIGVHLGETVRARGYVDTGPLLERDLARRAGLGWFGKNTNLIHPTLGSFFFLGALIVELELEPDLPFEADRCGTCTRCIDACPTDAITAPWELDARRCISYLTIELREDIPVSLRDRIGALIYGCDICQEVCPWNEKFAKSLPDESPFAPRQALVGKGASALARDLLSMSKANFSAAFKNSPMKRAKLRGLKRNAAVVLGNARDSAAVADLSAALGDDDPLVRGHAAWALGNIGSVTARDAIRTRMSVESDSWVIGEMHSALSAIGS